MRNQTAFSLSYRHQGQQLISVTFLSLFLAGKMSDNSFLLFLPNNGVQESKKRKQVMTKSGGENK